MNESINYERLARAIQYYKSLRYEYVELSWTARLQAIDVTKPKKKKDYPLYGDQYLVGSGEQTFIDLLLRNKISNGKFFGVTPCFRDDKIDELHNKCFMKLELINIYPKYSVHPKRPYNKLDMFRVFEDVDDIKNDALEFFNSEGNKTVQFAVVDDINPGYKFDIVSLEGGIEVGSYGFNQIREKGIAWVYGTGLAEPRFSKALSLEKNEK